MPDHLHWLVQLGEGGELATVMKLFKARSARAVNRTLGRSAPIWQRAYHDHALRHDENLRQAARYVVGNPWRAGRVSHIGDYPLWDAVWLWGPNEFGPTSPNRGRGVAQHIAGDPLALNGIPLHRRFFPSGKRPTAMHCAGRVAGTHGQRRSATSP